MSKWSAGWLDSFYHYRVHVGCGVFYAMYRATYYELRRKEPKKWRGVPL